MKFFVFVFFLIFLLGCGEEEVVVDSSLDLDSAREIALSSDCVDSGGLTEFYFYNEGTSTWWFDLDVVI